MEFRSFSNYLQYEKRYSAHTVSSYLTDLNQFSQFRKVTFGSEKIEEALHPEIRSWLVSLMESGMNSRSINRKISTLKTFFRFQLRNGKVTTNPMSRIISPKLASRLPVFVKESSMERLLDQTEFGDGFSGERNRLILELLYATGMRRAELISLASEAIDHKRLQIRILGKGNKERMVPISSDLSRRIRKYEVIREQHFNSKTFPALIVTDKGEKMYPAWLYRIVHSILKQFTTAEKNSPHILRHTFATHLLNNGAEINAIKELLGHASLAATQVYTHNTIDKLKDIYKKAHPRA